MSRRAIAVLLPVLSSVLALCTACYTVKPNDLTGDELWRDVLVHRDAYGVPHIVARDFAAAGYAMAYVQCEDYGAQVVNSLLRARGEMGRYFGRDSMRADFNGRLAVARAKEVYGDVDEDTRDVYEGFAAGVNRWIELHADRFPAGFWPLFTGWDVLAKDVELPPVNQAARFVPRAEQPASGGPDDGSNAWAFAPSRTESGHAVLVRNPHLAWTAGYYEAHIVVPGEMNFYGDLRIGGPFSVVGGFNPYLGWATTNNDPILWQLYSLATDPADSMRYVLDGESHALDRTVVRADYRTAAGLDTDSTVVFRTSLGPVIRRDRTTLYVMKAANDMDYHGGEQFLRMMRAGTLGEWQDAMRMRARINSSFTYADVDGNIYYVWNASLPSLPHPATGDTTAIPVKRTTDAWTHLVPYDSLPQFLNPPWGYVHNENDAPYYTNMFEPLDPKKYPAYFPPPRLGLRSQLAISLIHNNRKLSLDEIIRLKHSYRMLLAERVGDDLIAAVKATNPTGDVARGVDVLEHWDRTAAPDARGGVLFDAWWRLYNVRGDSAFAESWDPGRPLATPRGLRNPARAASAFATAVATVIKRYGALDVPWGDVHRVRRGDVDVPVGGCASDEGCFRVLTYAAAPDGKLVANGSDGWVLVVEFGDQPTAYSILAYGESPDPKSPWYANQAAMFARGELKPVVWRLEDMPVAGSYRPGAPSR
ncbi:MAG TPA: penicillin acylase family protein [Gemmatimonadaceae bacterium]|jgi:acyl-homoserine-lactone acylase|nr:penicillin acylase family protein [Gemmatimonadaceae bacterium]